MKKKLKKIKRLDLYGLKPQNKGKITFGNKFISNQETEMRDLGDDGHPYG